MFIFCLCSTFISFYINFLTEFFRELISPSGNRTRAIIFGAIEIQGGGTMEIQSDVSGLSITCDSLWIRSGGMLKADRLSVQAQTMTIEQSGNIDLSYKVNMSWNLLYSV